MAGRFKWCSFKDVNLNDVFFDSLKGDYPEFSDWFERKSIQDNQTLVFSDESGVGAFLYLKEEDEPIELVDATLPALPRLKIGTLRIAEKHRGMRLGEGAIGVALWQWRSLGIKEIYVTVFEKHVLLIKLFEEFGFLFIGYNARHERIYLKDRDNIDYSTPFSAFPFLNPHFEVAGVVPIYDEYHDTLFPYSELKGVKEVEEHTAKNGIKKVFIATPFSGLSFREGQPVFIYRIHTGDGQKTYKSVITSVCTITKVYVIKSNDRFILNFEEFLDLTSNKTAFDKNELNDIYTSRKNVILIDMIYNGFFGKGHNVSHRELSDANLFPCYPYNIKYTREEFNTILKMGDADEHDFIIN